MVPHLYQDLYESALGQTDLLKQSASQRNLKSKSPETLNIRESNHSINHGSLQRIQSFP